MKKYTIILGLIVITPILLFILTIKSESYTAKDMIDKQTKTARETVVKEEARICVTQIVALNKYSSNDILECCESLVFDKVSHIDVNNLTKLATEIKNKNYNSSTNSVSWTPSAESINVCTKDMLQAYNQTNTTNINEPKNIKNKYSYNEIYRKCMFGPGRSEYGYGSAEIDSIFCSCFAKEIVKTGDFDGYKSGVSCSQYVNKMLHTKY